LQQKKVIAYVRHIDLDIDYLVCLGYHWHLDEQVVCIFARNLKAVYLHDKQIYRFYHGIT